MSAPPRNYRIGIDVGGTFTDFVLADLARGTQVFHKEPSVPADPSHAVATGIAALLRDNDVAPAALELIVHGTTIALNAIIQRRGARIALVVSRGSRDVMELARGRLPSSYNYTASREPPLIPRIDVFEVSARGLADGSVLREIDEAELDALGETLANEGFVAVAVMLLNSYRDGALEARVARGLARRLPGVLVTASAELWPEIREYERALVAALNAYVHPLMEQYCARLTERLADLGITAPVHVTSNNGGTISLATARQRPIDSVLSGPASGVQAALRMGAALPGLLTFDMGGTSTDIGCVRSGALEFSRNAMVGDYPLMLPVVSVSAIGAGGGSIVWVDRQGVLKVGPESAGASPGPVCYRLGGARPTITDAYLVLSLLHPDRFLGGRIRLDKAAAAASLAAIGRPIGLADAAETAQAVLRVATAKMATELTKFLAQRGADPREFSLVAYGGAGPTHANFLAEEARLGSVLVPLSPGTFCALGGLLSDIRRDFARAVRLPVGGDSPRWAEVLSLIDSAAAEALDWIAREGALIRERVLLLACDMRYAGQAYELVIDVPEFQSTELSGETLANLFHAEHARLYGFAETGAVELTSLRLSVLGRLRPLRLPERSIAGTPEPFERRRAWFDGWVEAPVYRRGDIGGGHVIDGPAIIEQPDTTVVILPRWRARCDAVGNLLLRRGE